MATLLEEIAKRIKEFDDDEKEQIEKARPKPFTLKEYTVPDFFIPVTRDKKQINEFRKILTFIKKKAQYLRQKNTCTIMPISSTSEDLKKIWSNVSRGRALMMKIGLIRPFSDDYRSYGRITYAKQYMYFYENEVKFIAYCKEHGISVLDLDKKEDDKQPRIFSGVIDESKVRIGKGLYLNKPKDLSCDEFVEELLEIFKKNYPEYQRYKDMVDEINEKYYSKKEHFKISFEPSFHWNKTKTRVMSIGFRATNDYCSEEKEKRPSIRSKNDLVLDFDVNGSVPRLNSSMNLGHWNNDSRDMYEIIFHECYPNEEFTESARDALKQLLIRAYFEKTTKLLTNHIWKSISHESLYKSQVYKEMELLDSSIKKAVGPIIFGTEIYYVEGCVYLSVVKDILDSGHFAWFLYDGLYATGPNINEMFRSLVSRMIQVRFNKFYKEYRDYRDVIN